MAIICRDLKLLYIMVGGTGCSSVGSVLMERFGRTLLPACPLAGIDQKHNSIKQLVEHNLVSPKELKSYFKVANARNPFDRVASQYARLHGTSWEEFLKNPNSWVYKNKNYPDILRKEIEYAREVNFEKWVFKKYGFRSRVKAWLKYYLKSQGFPPGQHHTLFTDGVNRYIRFEYIEEDFNAILQKVGVLDWVSVPNRNPTSGKKTYQDYYTYKSRKLIEKVFSQELTKFGYTFGKH
jgi:hypothetical protein